METRLVRIAQPWAAWHGQHLRKEKHLQWAGGKPKQTRYTNTITLSPDFSVWNIPRNFRNLKGYLKKKRSREELVQLSICYKCWLLARWHSNHSISEPRAPRVWSENTNTKLESCKDSTAVTRTSRSLSNTDVLNYKEHNVCWPLSHYTVSHNTYTSLLLGSGILHGRFPANSQFTPFAQPQGWRDQYSNSPTT